MAMHGLSLIHHKCNVYDYKEISDKELDRLFYIN